MGWAPIIKLGREAVATFNKHSVKMNKQNKTNNQRHESTIDKYLERTAGGYRAWVEDNEYDRNFLLLAVEITGDTDEEGERDCDLHISYSYKTDILANGIAQIMERDEDFRQLILAAAKMYYTANIKIKDNETNN